MKIAKTFKLLSLLALIILLFVGGPDERTTRSINSLWNLGHIPLFMLLTHWLISPPSPIARRTLWQQCAVVGLVTLLLGVTIEWLQAYLGRSSDYADMARNGVGALLGLAFLRSDSAQWYKLGDQVLKSAAALAFLLACLPLLTAVMDEYRASQSFPRLASFQHDGELGRWSVTGDSQLAVEVLPETIASPALRVSLGTAEFSGANLDYFPGNWTGYQELVIGIYSPDPQPIFISLRIHDRPHSLSKQEHHDRYNDRLELRQGLNTIRLSLSEIAEAPRGRSMKLDEIESLQLFASNLPTPGTIYIQTLYLQ